MEKGMRERWGGGKWLLQRLKYQMEDQGGNCHAELLSPLHFVCFC